jgi:hypothetical protein
MPLFTLALVAQTRRAKCSQVRRSSAALKCGRGLDVRRLSDLNSEPKTLNSKVPVTSGGGGGGGGGGGASGAAEGSDTHMFYGLPMMSSSGGSVGGIAGAHNSGGGGGWGHKMDQSGLGLTHGSSVQPTYPMGEAALASSLLCFLASALLRALGCLLSGR